MFKYICTLVDAGSLADIEYVHNWFVELEHSWEADLIYMILSGGKVYITDTFGKHPNLAHRVKYSQTHMTFNLKCVFNDGYELSQAPRKKGEHCSAEHP